jgi:signal transduction histidine kinase
VDNYTLPLSHSPAVISPGAILMPALALGNSALCLFLALLLRSAPRVGRFRQHVPFQVVAIAGGVYAALGALHTLGLPEVWEVTAARVQVPAAGLSLWALFVYTEVVLGEGPPWLGKTLRAAALAGCVLYETVGMTGHQRVVDVPWLGVSSATGEQTLWGQLAAALLSAPLVVVNLRFLRAALQRKEGALVRFGATGALAVSGLLDAASTSGLIAAPQTLPTGLTFCLVLLAGELARNWREDAEALDRLREDLQVQVEERGRALADTRDRLQRTERLALVGRLAGGMAHEINNPMAALTANVDYLRANVRLGALPPDADECLEEALGSARRVGDTVRQLLLLSRSAAAEVDGEQFSVDAVTSRAVAAAERQVARTGWVDAAVAPGLTIGGRGNLLERLLTELLVAAERSPATERPPQLSAVADGDQVVLSVSRPGEWLPAVQSASEGLFVGRTEGADAHPLVVTLNLLRITGAQIAVTRAPDPAVSIGLRRGAAAPG